MHLFKCLLSEADQIYHMYHCVNVHAYICKMNNLSHICRLKMPLPVYFSDNSSNNRIIQWLHMTYLTPHRKIMSGVGRIRNHFLLSPYMSLSKNKFKPFGLRRVNKTRPSSWTIWLIIEVVFTFSVHIKIQWFLEDFIPIAFVFSFQASFGLFFSCFSH